MNDREQRHTLFAVMILIALCVLIMCIVSEEMNKANASTTEIHFMDDAGAGQPCLVVERDGEIITAIHVFPVQCQHKTSETKL